VFVLFRETMMAVSSSNTDEMSANKFMSAAPGQSRKEKSIAMGVIERKTPAIIEKAIGLFLTLGVAKAQNPAYM